jgi:hypothetical protein
MISPECILYYIIIRKSIGKLKKVVHEYLEFAGEYERKKCTIIQELIVYFYKNEVVMSKIWAQLTKTLQMLIDISGGYGTIYGNRHIFGRA